MLPSYELQDRTAGYPPTTLFQQAESEWLCSSLWRHCIACMFWIFAVKCYADTESFRELLRHLSQPLPGLELLNGLEATGTRSYLCADKFNDIKKEQQIVDHQT